MNEPENKPSFARRCLRIVVRAGVILALAAIIGTALSLLSARLERDTRPAGFARGMLQGALMPMALPTLLVGHDVSIYAAHNTGVRYKLGYTAGVNVCGAVFFGFFFRRLSRLRKSAPQNH